MKLDVLVDKHLEKLLDAVQAIFLVPVGFVTHANSLAPLL